MARTLATTTAKKRKVIMGAAALGTAGLIGWGAAMTMLYTCAPATNGYIPVARDPHLADITQDIKITLTQRTHTLDEPAGKTIIASFTGIHGEPLDTILPTPNPIDISEAIDPSNLEYLIEQSFASEIDTNGSAWFTRVLVAFLFNESLADEINKNDMVKDTLHINIVDKQILIYGQAGPGDSPLIKSIMEAPGNKIEIGLGINMGFGVTNNGDETYTNNNATQITIQTSAPITFQINDSSQESGGNSLFGDNLLGRIFGPLLQKATTSSIKENKSNVDLIPEGDDVFAAKKYVGLPADSSSSPESDGGEEGLLDGFPPCRITFQTGRYDFAVYNYRINYDFFNAYVMNGYVYDDSTIHSINMGLASLVGYGPGHNIETMLEFPTSMTTFSQFDFLGMKLNAKLNAIDHSDPSIAILPVLDEAENIRDSGIQIRVFDAQKGDSDPTTYGMRAPDFQVYGGMQFVMNNVMSITQDGELATLGQSTKRPIYLSFADVLCGAPSFLLAVSLWNAPISGFNPAQGTDDAFRVARELLIPYIKNSGDNFIPATTTTSLDNGMSGISTALAADREASGSKGDPNYTATKAAAVSLANTQTEPATGKFETENTMAKRWLQDRLKNANPNGTNDSIRMQLQYSSGSTIGDGYIKPSQIINKNSSLSENGVRTTIWGERCLLTRNESLDRFDGVGQGVRIIPSIINGWSSGEYFQFSATSAREFNGSSWGDSDPNDWIENLSGGPDGVTCDISQTPDAQGDGIACVEITFKFDVINSKDGIESQESKIYIYPANSRSWNDDEDAWDKGSINNINSTFSYILGPSSDEDSQTKLSIKTKYGDSEMGDVSWSLVDQSSNIDLANVDVNTDGTVTVDSVDDSNRGWVKVKATWDEFFDPDDSGTDVTIKKTSEITIPVYEIIPWNDDNNINQRMYINIDSNHAFFTHGLFTDITDTSKKYILTKYSANQWNSDSLYLVPGISLTTSGDSFSLALNNNMVSSMQLADEQTHGAITGYNICVRYYLYNGGTLTGFIPYEPTYISFKIPVQWTW